MADSDGPITDKSDPRYVAPVQVKPVAPAPRVNPPNINNAKDTPPVAGPAGFGDFLEWMRSQVGGETASAAGQRGLIPKEKKKFQRRDTETKADIAAATPTAAEPALKDVPEVQKKSLQVAGAPIPAAAALADSSEVAWSENISPNAAGPSSTRVRRGQAPAKRNSWLGLATQVGVLILLVGSFLMGRITASRVATPAPAAPAAPEIVNADGKATTNILSDANAKLIDQAMAAVQDSDFKKAGELLGSVRASGQHVSGLAFQLAQLAIFEGDFNRAIPLLNDTLVTGENLGDAYNMRATLSARARRVQGTVLNDFETATKVDPFSARNFFYWGEALRRMGKDQAAIVRLQEAIDRLREPEMESLYRLKLRLAKIEAGQEKDFADELARQLALPNPEMDWLFTAAAQEIHRGNFAAAAGFLDRAELRGDAQAFTARLRDYYLYQFQYEKELARFYAKTPDAQPNGAEKHPAPTGSPSQATEEIPTIGLDVPVLPPPASPFATMPH